MVAAAAVARSADGRPIGPTGCPRRTSAAGAAVDLYTSGWKIREPDAARAVRTFSRIGVSIDAADPALCDRLRGRAGSFREASRALHALLRNAPRRGGANVGIEYTVMRSNVGQVDRFCREEIFEPLAMKDTRFEAEPDIAPRLAPVRMRGEDGHFAEFELAPPAKPEFYGMGHTLYSTAPDYMRFLRMVLNKGQLDGRSVVSEGGLRSMLANQIGDQQVLAECIAAARGG